MNTPSYAVVGSHRILCISIHISKTSTWGGGTHLGTVKVQPVWEEGSLASLSLGMQVVAPVSPVQRRSPRRVCVCTGDILSAHVTLSEYDSTRDVVRWSKDACEAKEFAIHHQLKQQPQHGAWPSVFQHLPDRSPVTLGPWLWREPLNPNRGGRLLEQG